MSTTTIKGELRAPVVYNIHYTISQFIRFESSIEKSIFIHQNMKLLSKLSKGVEVGGKTG